MVSVSEEIRADFSAFRDYLMNLWVSCINVNSFSFLNANSNNTVYKELKTNTGVFRLFFFFAG